MVMYWACNPTVTSHGGEPPYTIGWVAGEVSLSQWLLQSCEPQFLQTGGGGSTQNMVI